MSELITVPTFTFRQGKNSDSTFEENPITVSFYNGSIELSQEGAFDTDEKILLSPNYIDALFKAIKKNMPEAKEWLDRKTF